MELLTERRPVRPEDLNNGQISFWYCRILYHIHSFTPYIALGRAVFDFAQTRHSVRFVPSYFLPRLRTHLQDG
jgi:hypothetical protein